MKHSEPEEHEHHHKRYGYEEHYVLHGDVELPAHWFLLRGASAELAHSQACGLSYDAARLYDAYHTGHGYAADAYQTGVFREHCVRGQRRKLSRSVGAQKRDYHPPYKCRACEYHKRVFQTHDITETKQCGSGVAAHYQLGLFHERGAPRSQSCGDILGPHAEGGEHVIIDTADKSGYHKGLGLTAGSLAFGLAAHEHLCGGGSFGERVFSVHLLHEIFTEGDEEKNAEYTAQE